MIVKNWVSKKPRSSDKRLVDIIISKKGEDLLEKIDTAKNKIGDILINLSHDEAQTINQLLDKMRND